MRFNKLVPELEVTDLNRSLEFYKAIGFKVEYSREEDEFAFLSFQGSQLMIQRMNGNWCTGRLERPFGRGINLQFEVRRIAPILARLKKARYPVMVKPHENWYRVRGSLIGVREFLVKDPDGYLLRFSEKIGKKTE